jgi:hypothetical protein
MVPNLILSADWALPFGIRRGCILQVWQMGYTGHPTDTHLAFSSLHWRLFCLLMRLLLSRLMIAYDRLPNVCH